MTEEEIGLKDLNYSDCKNILDSPSPKPIRRTRHKIQKQQSLWVSAPKVIFNKNNDDESKSARSKPRRQHSNLFPCPLVKTLDLDSPDGSLSSLGIVSGLNHYSVPFASSTSYTLSCQQQKRQQRKMPPRAKSVQSPSQAQVVMPYSPMMPSWPARQQSLPTCTITPEPSISEQGLGARKVSPNSRSPRTPTLKQAKSLHAQTHKLKRQVTICEDSVSIPDSQLFLSRQCSYSDSQTFTPINFNHDLSPSLVFHNGQRQNAPDAVLIRSHVQHEVLQVRLAENLPQSGLHFFPAQLSVPVQVKLTERFL